MIEYSVWSSTTDPLDWKLYLDDYVMIQRLKLLNQQLLRKLPIAYHENPLLWWMWENRLSCLTDNDQVGNCCWWRETSAGKQWFLETFSADWTAHTAQCWVRIDHRNRNITESETKTAQKQKHLQTEVLADEKYFQLIGQQTPHNKQASHSSHASLTHERPSQTPTLHGMCMCILRLISLWNMAPHIEHLPCGTLQSALKPLP